MSPEERVVSALYGVLPEETVRTQLIPALRDMTMEAAKTVHEERYIGPSEQQLDDVAEAAAARMSLGPRTMWKTKLDGEGVVMMSPFKVVKMHQSHINRNTVGRFKLEEEIAQLREKIDIEIWNLQVKASQQHQLSTYVDEENSTIQDNFKAIVVAMTALELKHDKRITAIEKKLAAAAAQKELEAKLNVAAMDAA